jgi:hypothetical protein
LFTQSACFCTFARLSWSCSSTAHAAMHSFSSNGMSLFVEVMHSYSRPHTCLQRVLRGWVQPMTASRSRNRTT